MCPGQVVLSPSPMMALAQRRPCAIVNSTNATAQTQRPNGANRNRLLQGWGENDRGVSYTFGPDCVTDFLQKHDLDLVCRAHQVRASRCFLGVGSGFWEEATAVLPREEDRAWRASCWRGSWLVAHAGFVQIVFVDNAAQSLHASAPCSTLPWSGARTHRCLRLCTPPHNLHPFAAPFQVVEEGYEFFAKRQLVTIFSAPNYCGEFENAGAMMSVDETLMCSFQVSLVWRLGCSKVSAGAVAQHSAKSIDRSGALKLCFFYFSSLLPQILKPAEKKQKAVYGGY